MNPKLERLKAAKRAVATASAAVTAAYEQVEVANAANAKAELELTVAKKEFYKSI